LLKKEQIEVVAGIEESTPTQTLDPIAQIQAEIRQLKEDLKRRRVPRVPVSPAKAEYQGEGGSSYPSAANQSAVPKPSSIAAFLVRTGLVPVFAERVVSEMAELDPLNQPLAAQIACVADALRRQWKGDTIRTEAGVHVFVGVPGVGKSTVLCKMVTQASLAEAQPAAIYQLDTLVTNNSPQPALFSEILGAHFERTLPSQFEWSEQSVFIDLPGIGLGDTRGREALARTIQAFGVPEIHLVLNAAYESAHLLEQVRFFSKLEISDLVITHLDEEQRWGKIWNLVLGTNYSVRFLSAGQNVPGEFFPATADAVLNRQFGSK
jgi:flagellar biosynthesis GTPase FlhF